MIEIYNQKEIEEYYDEKTNTYVFDDDVRFNCSIYIKSNIHAKKIDALNIYAFNIHASDIDAWDIKAYDIYVKDNIIAWTIVAKNIDARGNIHSGKISTANKKEIKKEIKK